MPTWLIDYVKLKFREVLLPANLKRIEVGLVIQIYQKLIVRVDSIFLSMDLRPPVHTGLINS